MKKIQVCIGSGCHLKGAHLVINKLKELVDKHQAQVEIKLTASFCQGHCTEGVVVRINDQCFTRIGAHNVEALFAEEVLSS